MNRLLRPLQVNVLIEERRFLMGEALEVTLEIESRVRGDLEIREGSVRLEYAVGFMPSNRGSPSDTKMAFYRVAPSFFRNSRYEMKLTSDSAVMVTGDTLVAGSLRRYAASLDIRRDQSLYRSDITVQWKLVARFDLVMARDVTTSVPIQVTSG